MTADATCTSCRRVLRATAKFCDECGLSTAADPAEYKQVTVLFADVVHSMDLAAALDLERLREVMTELLEISAAVARRYGGMVEYNGDGVMAIFGAPITLEDHAFRGCLTAMAVQQETQRLAAEVERRDGVTLQVRVGLNSGRVIAGEIGSGSLGYRAIGEHVGMAQRLESAASPGEVMLSESTARLVEHRVTLAEPEWVRIKGADDRVRAYRLVAIDARDGRVGQAETSLVGRRWEMAAIEAIVDRAIGGRGGVVNVVGSAGIGKSRVAREAATAAAGRGVEVFWTFCESHTRDVPFHAATRLLRAGSGVADLDSQAARKRVRARMPTDADPLDLLLLDDLLGIAEPNVALPEIAPDARRRRVTGLINSAWLARTDPALFLIEDAHWVDSVSESMLADFLAVMPRTPSMVLITSRPEYDGALMRVHGAQTVTLAPLPDSDSTALLDELIGSNPSTGELKAVIAERAAGNPFFAEEIVREMAQRGVLTGGRGNYMCHTNTADIAVPATVEAAIAARIDGLSTPAKQTLNAASVIGARFGADLLAALGIDAVIDELINGELVEQVRFTPSAEYAFHHPLIRSVAYETQLKSDRAQWHRRLATAIEASNPDMADQNAAVIAEHHEAAGELRAAYGWHMRAAARSSNRDVGAARISWERAQRIGDRLPDDASDKLSMRIAPRTMLCATDWQARAVQQSRARFAELRELCSSAGDKVSLVIAMTGLASELLYAGRPGEGARLASEQMALLESIGDPTLTIGLSFVAFVNWFNVGEFSEISRWSQTVIDLAGSDPAKGAGFGMGSPLAIALAFRALARWWLGRPRWLQDLHDALGMARNSDPTTFAFVVAWTYGVAIHYGVLRANESAMHAAEQTMQIADESSNDRALSGAQFTLGAILLHRDAAADRGRGLDLMVLARDKWLPKRVPSLVPVAEVLIAREWSKRGDRDAAIPTMRRVVDDLHKAGRLGWGVWAAGVLVETLLERGTEDDLSEAQKAFERLADLDAEQDSAILEITLLRLRALLARTRGDESAYGDLVSRYRAMAKSLAFEGHIAWAEAMVEGE
jgi:class 3 adenylate cyclase